MILSKSHFLASLNELNSTMEIEVFDQLVEAYNSADRFYHNLTHIDDCLSKLEENKQLASCPAEISMAFYFHDAIYDTRRNDNEDKSAEWAVSYLNRSGIEHGQISRIEEMILATRSHFSEHPDTILMLDIDLSIVGSDEEHYLEYSQAIRKEYAWVPELEYQNGRAKVLENFLARPQIFLHEHFYSLYEAKARINLENELKNLI